jgi:hypothetical protein
MVTLSERLAEAGRQRRIEAGEEVPDPPRATAAQAIDLTSDGEEPLFQAIEYQGIPVLHLVPDKGPHVFEARVDAEDRGQHSSCPSCGAEAHVDMVDLVAHTTHLSCDVCGTLWYTSTHTATPADHGRG